MGAAIGATCSKQQGRGGTSFDESISLLSRIVNEVPNSIRFL
jgi:hypothetical protein